MQYISQEKDLTTEPTKASIVYAWLGTVGALAVFTYLAARDGGYFAMNFYPAAIASWTVLGLVIIAAWDDLHIAADARAPLLALGMIALWTGLSSAWSISPNLSLQEFTRETIYLACFLLVLSGSASLRSVRFTTVIYVCITTGLAGFAMLARIFPDYSENYVYAGGRLMGSIGYWNGLAALMAIGIIPCLWLASSPAIPRLARAVFSCALSLMGLTLFFTLSRGGLAVCIASIALYIILAPDRLASLLSLLSSLLPAGLLAWYAAAALPSLNASGDGVRIDPADGRMFAILLSVTLLAVAIIKFASMLLPARIPENRAGVAFIIAFWLLAAIALAGLIMTQRDSIAEKLTHWRSSAEVQVWQYDQASVDERGVERLASTSDNRTEFWRIGLTNFREHPLAGTGGGTYRFANFRLQSGEGLARDPHSVWIRFLSDQGIVGFILLLALMASLATGIVRHLLAKPGLRRNGLYISLAIAGLAWIADSSFEWNWALPAVTIQFFIICGLLFRLGAAPEQELIVESDGFSESVDLPDSLAIPTWLRMAVLALVMGLTFIFSAFLISRMLVESAVDDLAYGEITTAEFSAGRAHKLNPFSVDPLLIQARAATARGDYDKARQKMLAALDREPEKSSLLEELSQLEFYYLYHINEGIISLTAAIDRDPQNDTLHIKLHRMLNDTVIYEQTVLMPEPPVIEEES